MRSMKDWEPSARKRLNLQNMKIFLRKLNHLIGIVSTKETDTDNP